MTAEWDLAALEAAHREGFLRAACASVGIEHNMDTDDVLATYKAAGERLEADPVGLAEYQDEARKWAELDVEVRDE